MDTNDIDWERLDRYVRGDGSPEERAALERWVNAHPERRRLADAMRAAGGPVGLPARQWDAQAAWFRLRRRMRRPAEAPLRIVRPPVGRDVEISQGGWAARWRRAAASPLARALAAALVLAALSPLAIGRMRHGTTPPPEMASAMRDVVTHRGQRAVLDLADGSRVILGAESRLRIPSTFASASPGVRRDVYLEGEGYFEVKHDERRPFFVHTSAGIAEDIGTEFVVTAYPETRGMRVVVASGAVALRHGSADTGTAADTARPLLTLKRGDLARLDTLGTATLTRGVDVRPYLAWTEGGLAFDGTRLGDAVRQINRWYDVDVRLADSTLASRRVTATFHDEPVSQVLDMIALPLGLQIERHGRAIILSPKSRSSHAS
jgi:transmembrane sensor